MAFADRLVECGPLRKSVELVYATILPKASKPFIYMSIALPSEHVDVNVHPTKREVNGIDVFSSSPWGLFLNLSIFVLYTKTTWIESSRPQLIFHPLLCKLNLQVSFLNQDCLVDTIQQAVEAKLLESNNTRTFTTQVSILLGQRGPDNVYNPDLNDEGSLGVHR